MRKIFYTFCLLNLILFESLIADALQIPIKEVLVYSDRAQVTRKLKMEILPGENVFQVRGLPPKLHDNTLQSYFSSGKDLNITSINSYIELKNAYKDMNVREITEKMDVLEKNKRNTQARLEGLENEKMILEQFRKLSMESISVKVSYLKNASEINSWKKAVESLPEKFLEIERKIHNQKKIMEKLDLDYSLLRQKLDDIVSRSEKSIRITEVKIMNSSSKTINDEFAITYVIPDSSWSPVYNVSVNENGKTEIEYLAEIKQETGEDWKESSISLSTAEPKKAQSRPRIHSLRLYDIEVEKKSDSFFSYEKSMPKDSSPASSGAVPEAEPVPPTEMDGEVDRTAGSLVFKSAHLSTIPSGKEKHRILISRFKSDSKPELTVYPKIVRRVYLVATIKNVSPFPMLPGKANLYKGSGYIGDTTIPYVSPNSEFQVSFGIENNIRVNYTSYLERKKEGFVTNKNVSERFITIQLENFESVPKTVTVVDQIPVSDTEEIKVEINNEKTTPGFKEKRKDSGILVWSLPIPPDTKKEIKLQFQVKFPEKADLNF